MSWTRTRVDRVASVNARIGWKALTASEYQTEGYAFLSTPNIKAKEIDFENVNYITEYRYHESPELKLQPGDVLLVKDGMTLGITNVVRHLPKPATVNGSIAVLRPLPSEIEPRFLRYSLASSPTQNLIQALKDGMDILHLFQRDIKRLPIDLPPLEEQQRIADFLDAETARIDGLLKATNQQLELLTARRMEYFRSLTTGADVGTSRTTGISWMPYISSEWELHKVGRSFLTGSGTTPRASDNRYFDGAHPWINTSDLRDGPIGQPIRSVTDAALLDYPTLRTYPIGTLMVAMYGATIGRVGISTVPACVNQACCALTSLGSVDVSFALYWFLSHRAEIMRLGSGGGQPNISQDLIRSLKIPSPTSAEEQRGIASKCEEIENDILERQTLLTQRSALLLERKQAIITTAVTGGITL